MNFPTQWTVAQLGDLTIRIVGGGTPSKALSANFEGAIPFMTVKDMKARFVESTVDHISKEAIRGSATTMVPADTLIVATRMSLGKIVRPKLDVAINQDLKALFLEEEVEKTYIEYFWRSKSQAIQAMGTGTTVKGIRLEDIRTLAVPLAPKNEQKRIADKLDTVLTRVDAVNTRLARVAPLIKRFRQSVLAAATSGRLTEDWRAVHGTTADNLACISSIQQAKHAWLKENGSHNEAGRIAKRIASFSNRSISDNGLPRSWCWTALEDAVLMVVDCHNKTAPYVANGIPLVRTTNVRDGAFVWDDLRFVNEQTHQFWSKRCVPTSGDIVFTREAPMGEAAIIPADIQICLGQRTMLIRPVGEATSGQYLLIALLDPTFKMRAGEVAVGTGVKHLRVGDVSELKLPLPPIDEQTEIVRRVETLFAFADRLEARLQNAQTAADRLTPSLLAKAFRGELVPQDPNDEPASELLKRLTASTPVSPTKRGRAKSTKAV